MNNFLKKVLKRVETEIEIVEQDIVAAEHVVLTFVTDEILKLKTEEKVLWAMARAELEALAAKHNIVDVVTKTTNAIIVELKKLGLVK